MEAKYFFSFRKFKGGLLSVAVAVAFLGLSGRVAADEAVSAGEGPVSHQAVQEEILAAEDRTATERETGAGPAGQAVSESQSSSEPGQQELGTNRQPEMQAEASQPAAETSASQHEEEVKPASKGFVERDGNWYYLDENGQAVTGQVTIDSQPLYFNADGLQVKDGFGTGEDGKKRYYAPDNGVLRTNQFLYYDGNWYYLTGDGSVAAGSRNVNGQELYFREDGRQVKGEFVTIDGQQFYYDPQTGERLVQTSREIDGQAYDFDSNGVAKAASQPAARVEKTSIVVDSYEFGPAVSKIILQFDRLVTPAVVHAQTRVTLNGLETEVLNSYVSDAMGHVIFFDSSYYVTLEMAVKAMGQNASPFVYNGVNQWVGSYPVRIRDLQIQAEESGKSMMISSEMDAIQNRLTPRLDAFSERGNWRGLNYAAFTPRNARGGERNPLIVWLHGRGEVGTDMTIPLLAADVAKLTEDPIQNHFTSTGRGRQKGAYVLAIQSPQALTADNLDLVMGLIRAYVNSHPDVDFKRIYLAGASMGGAATLSLAIQNPGYFAALVPVAAPTDAYMTDGQVTASAYQAIKDTPIWFVHTAADQAIAPEKHTLPFYKSLLTKGAGNKWLSYFETNESSFASAQPYNGHWSWVYFFNDQVAGVQNAENARTWEGLTGMVATNPYHGGDAAAFVAGRSYRNIFDWLNAQRRR